MDKPRSKETVVLPVSLDPVRVHHQALHQFFPAHGEQADQYGKSDDDVGDGHGFELNERVKLAIKVPQLQVFF
jgi:hypothetical protein